MDDKGLGMVAMLIVGALGLVVAAAAVGGILYITDTTVGATVVGKECGSNPLGKSSLVTVQTKFPVPGVEHTLQDFDNGLCRGLRAGDSGNFAEYFLQSKRTILYERDGGPCIYDSIGILC